MIQPVTRGGALLAEVRATRTPPGGLAVWWLGQSGFLLKSGRGTLLIDPYLSEYLTAKYAGTDRPHVRMTEAPLRGRDLAEIDLALVLCSHKHSDHLDPGTVPDVLAASPSARLVLPRAILGHARSLGLPEDRLVPINAGESVAAGDFRVTAVPSAHEDFDVTPEGDHPYLGFVIEVAGGLRLYHSGDTMPFAGQADWLGGRFDVLFLPINGRDPARGVAGNMGAAEVVELAARVKPRFVVPHHYDMFTFNTAPVGDFLAESVRLPGGVAPVVLGCGERWEVRP